MRIHIALDLPRDARYVSVMRNLAHCLLTDLAAPDDAVDDIKLAVTEACANVVNHATGVDAYSISLEVDEDGCLIEVVDLGQDLLADGRRGELSHHTAETGRGLFIMRALVDDLQFLREDDSTRVRLVKRWAGVRLGSAHAAEEA